MEPFDKVWWLSLLGTDPVHQRHGYATKLMDFVLTEASNSGVTCIVFYANLVDFLQDGFSTLGYVLRAQIICVQLPPYYCCLLSTLMPSNLFQSWCRRNSTTMWVIPPKDFSPSQTPKPFEPNPCILVPSQVLGSRAM